MDQILGMGIHEKNKLNLTKIESFKMSIFPKRGPLKFELFILLS